MALDAVELAGHQTSARQSYRNTDHQAQAELQQRPARHELEDASAVRAQRHANTDLASAPRHRVCRDAVESDTGQDQRQQSEELCEPRDELVLIEVEAKLLPEALHVEHGEVGIDVGEGPADSGLQVLRFAGHAQLDIANVIGADHSRDVGGFLSVTVWRHGRKNM